MASFLASLAASTTDNTENDLRYILDEKSHSIEGAIFNGLCNIWQLSTKSQKQIPDHQVAKTLELSGLKHEVLGEIWEEASQAVILDEQPTEMLEDTMYWKDFIVLLHLCYLRSEESIEVFLARFQPRTPAARQTAMKKKRNPFVKSGDGAGSAAAPAEIESVSSLSVCTEVVEEKDTTGKPGIPRVIGSIHSLDSEGSVTTRGPIAPQHQTMIYETGLELASSSPAEAPEVISPVTPSEYSPQDTQYNTKDQPNHHNYPNNGSHPASSTTYQQSQPTSHIPSPTYNPQLQTPSPPYDTHLPTFISELPVPHATPASLQIARNRLNAIFNEQPPTHGLSKTSALVTTIKHFSIKPKPFSSPTESYPLNVLGTGLERAAKEGRLDIIEAFLELGADINWKRREKGYRAMVGEVEEKYERVSGLIGNKRGKEGFVGRVLKKGVGERCRAVAEAAGMGFGSVVDFLVEKGADEESLEEGVVCAVVAGKAELATRLITVHNAPIAAAAFTPHHKRSFEYPFSSSSSITHSNTYITLLSSAIYISDRATRLQFLKLLLDRGCDVNAMSWEIYRARKHTKEGVREEGFAFGYSPLAMFVGCCPCPESVDLLLGAGADVYTPPSSPPPPLLQKIHSLLSSSSTTSQPIPLTIKTPHPISTLSPSTLSLPTSLEILSLLTFHGSSLHHFESSTFEELHPGEGKHNFSMPMNVYQRAKLGSGKAAIEWLIANGAEEEDNNRVRRGEGNNIKTLLGGKKSAHNASISAPLKYATYLLHYLPSQKKIYISFSAERSTLLPPSPQELIPYPSLPRSTICHICYDRIECEEARSKKGKHVFWHCDTCEGGGWNACATCIGDGKWCAGGNGEGGRGRHWLRFVVLEKEYI